MSAPRPEVLFSLFLGAALFLLTATGAAAGVAHSPDGTFLYVYSPCAWDQGLFPDASYQAVGNFIRNQDYDVTTAIYKDATSNDDVCGSATLQNFKDCMYADFLYVTTHGNENMMSGIYLKTEGAVNTWRNNELDTETRESGTVLWDGNPAYYAYVPAAWYATHWRAMLDQTKAIAILDACKSAHNCVSSAVSAAGGGVCFGYMDCPDAGDTDANNSKLLQRMNGTTDGATKRKAGEAYDGGAGYLEGFSIHGDPDITLCPAYEAKSPVGPTTAAGTGFFEVDTWCHDNVAANEALTFVPTGNVTVGNQRWVGTGKVRRIEFDWTGLCNFTVEATAHADKFHSWGAATSSYHRMDGNRVTPNSDDVVWTFSHVGQTRVELASFTAILAGTEVLVEWTTATEIDNAGFNLYRGLAKDMWSTRLNDELLPAQGDELQGASYAFTDESITPEVTYYYWLEDMDLDGKATIHGPASPASAWAEDVEGPAPETFSLDQNYPNPFGATTKITYALPVGGHVTLSVYNVMGQRVKRLVDAHQHAGHKEVLWDGKDEKGRPVSEGIYFYNHRLENRSEIRKMSLVR
jgi:hypothetical protein